MFSVPVTTTTTTTSSKTTLATLDVAPVSQRDDVYAQMVHTYRPNTTGCLLHLQSGVASIVGRAPPRTSSDGLSRPSAIINDTRFARILVVHALRHVTTATITIIGRTRFRIDLVCYQALAALYFQFTFVRF